MKVDQASPITHQVPRRTALALGGVLAVALALRLLALGRESLWLDEATSLMLARMPIGDLLAWTALDVHPPLYYLFLHFWLRLGQGEAALRGLSVLGGLAGVGLTFLVGRELFDDAVGLAAALLLAVAPLHVWYSQELRGYTWLAAFGMLAVYGLARLLRETWGEGGARDSLGGPLGWLAYILGAALGMYIHYYTVFVILAASVVVAALVLVRRRPYRLLVLWALAQVAVFVLYLPWLPNFLKPILGGGQGWVAEVGSPGLGALPVTLVSFMVGVAQPWLPVLLRRLSYGAFMVALGLGALWGIWPWHDEEARRRREGILVAAACFALPLGTAWLVSQVKPLFSGRYLLPFLPPFLLLVARGAMAAPRRWQRLLALALLLVAPLWGTAAQARHLEKPDWRRVAAEIAAQAQAGDAIVLIPSWNAKPLDYYLAGRVAVEFVPDVLDPARPEPTLQALEKVAAGHPRVWLIWAEGHYTDRKGVVASWLDGHGRPLATQSLPEVGKVILYDLRN